MKIFQILLFGLILNTACSVAVTSNSAIVVTTTPAELTAIATLDYYAATQSASYPTETWGGGLPPTCAYNWGTKPLPKLTKQWQEALANIQIRTSVTYAEAYGEDCLDVSGNILGFSTMQTDFHTVIEVDDSASAESLGDLTLKVVSSLETIPSQNIPQKIGVVTILFVAETWTQWVSFTVSSITGAREQGLTGEELLAWLESR